MNTVFEHINSSGTWFVDFAAPMLLQSSVLVMILLLVDLLLRKKVCAVFRYCMWMLILAKLILPSSLSSPVGIGNWLGYGLPDIPAAKFPVADNPIVNENLPFVPTAEAAQKTSVVKKTAFDVSPARSDIASQPLAKIAATLTWQGGVFLFWLVVAAAMGLLLLQRAVFVCGLIRQAKQANNLMNDTLRFCCGQMGIKRNVGLKVSANATSPAVCGLFRPVILIPENLGSDFGVAGLRAVLLHELAHIKRFDLWVNLIQTILQIVYFYNPFVWLANWLIRRIREQAVDEMVLVTMGEKAQQYPETLINVARLAFKRPALSLRLIGVVESKSALAQRIKHILNRPIPKSAKLGILGLAVILIFAAILLPMAKAKENVAQPPSAVNKSDSFTASLPNGVTAKDSRNLLMERRDILQKMLQTVEQKYNIGKADSKELQQAKIDLLRAESELAETPQKRIDILDQIVILYLEQEKTTKLLLNAGRATQDELNKVKLLRLDAEIDLARAKAVANEKQANFTATLPNSVTVELVVVCDYLNANKQCWKSDGSITNETFDIYNPDSFPLSVHENQIARGFVFKVTAPQNSPIVSKVEQSFRFEGGEKVRRPGEKDLPDLYGVTGLFSDNLESAMISIGVASGKWTTQVQIEGGTQGSVGGVIFSGGCGDKDGRVIITADHKFFDKDTRIVAVDSNGNEHLPSNVTSDRNNEWARIKASFENLAAQEVRLFDFQTRPYEWVEFKNVSLKPNFKTDVQIETEKSDEGKNTFLWPDSQKDRQINPDMPLQSQRKNEYEFSATFLEALKDKNWILVAAMRQSGHSDINNVSKLIETEDFRKANIESIYSDGQIAVSVSSLLEPGQDRGRDYHLSFIMVKENGSFVLKEIRQVWDGEKKQFIDEFLKSHPNAKPVKFYPFCVYGKITDTYSHPIAGATLRAHCGIGTLRQSGKTTTDENGNYRLYFGHGYRMSIKETDQWGVGFQAATIHAEKDGFYEKDFCQKGNLAMAGDTKYEISVQQMKNFKGVVLPNEPYELNFVMVPAAKIRGELIDKNNKPIANQKLWMSGRELYPSTNVLANIETDEQGQFEVNDVPLKEFWFEFAVQQGNYLRTKPFLIENAGIYHVKLQFDKDKTSFELTRLQNQTTDVQGEVAKPRPPAEN